MGLVQCPGHLDSAFWAGHPAWAAWLLVEYCLYAPASRPCQPGAAFQNPLSN